MNQNSLLVARKELARARKSLLAAEMLLKHELHEDAVSRAYYAVLHAAKSALATLDVFLGSHKSVRRMFGLRLVKTTIIEREYATILTAEQEDREFSDYDITIVIEKERATQRVNDARRFVARVEAYLGKIETHS